MPNELTNPNNAVTEERLAEFYQQILPYLGGMPDILANKFSKADLYSTDEKMIGRWIDGKPLYQKVMYSSTSTGSGSIAHGIENVDTIFVSDFFLRSSASPSKVRTYAMSQISTGNGVVKVDETNLTMQFVTSGWTSDQGYMAILKYTKTTDSAVEIGDDTDYSTTEKIVGTWIDGKPIYQRTFSSLSISLSSAGATAYATSQIDALLTDIKPLKCQITGVNGGYVTCEDACIRTMASNKWILYANNDMAINELTIQYVKTSS